MGTITLLSISDGGPSITTANYFLEKSVGQGTWALVAAGTFNGSYYGNANANGDNVSFYKYFVGGKYSFICNFHKSTNFGIIDVYIDSAIIMTADTYNGSSVLTTNYNTTNIIIPEGLRVLKFQVNGKNDLSSGYYARWSSFSFERIG